MMAQCVVHHGFDTENLPLTFRIPVTTLCREFVDEVAQSLSHSADTTFIYYDSHLLLDSIDKVYTALTFLDIFNCIVIARSKMSE